MVGNQHPHSNGMQGGFSHGMIQPTARDLEIIQQAVTYIDGVRRQLANQPVIYREFVRIVHCGTPSLTLPNLLKDFYELAQATLRLPRECWEVVREATKADSAASYMSRVQDLCPPEVYMAFIDALTRYRVENTPVDEVYVQVGQLFSKIGRIDLLDEFFMLHMPQDARERIVAGQRKLFPELDMLAGAAAERARVPDHL
eukprot:m.42590 g.42590  ORF g.42590 m.42590 type:complete len:200 (+) comp15032_c0_seq5:258-857(+)